METSQTKNFKKEDNVYFILPEAENKNNTAIDSVFIQQTLDNFYEIGIQISSNHTDNEEISVSLFNHDKLTAKTLVALKNKNQIISFNISKEDFNGYVTISDKGLPYDNTYYFTILKPQKNKVISIGDADKSTF